MTIFDQFRREKFKYISNFFTAEKKSILTQKSKLTIFQAFQEFVFFGQKIGPLTHCENHRKKIVKSNQNEFYGTIYAPNRFEN